MAFSPGQHECTGPVGCYTSLQLCERVVRRSDELIIVSILHRLSVRSGTPLHGDRAALHTSLLVACQTIGSLSLKSNRST